MRDIGLLNLAGTVIFFLAVIHTLLASRFTTLARRVQQRHDVRRLASGYEPAPSIMAEVIHFVGEVEVIFALWVVPLMLVFGLSRGWDDMAHYLNDTVTYTEALFVVVIMVLASTRPILTLAEAGLRRIATIGRCTPAAWWVTILTVGPLLGSFITEPAAMTICALLLARQFYDLGPNRRLKYATLGLLFVNVSIGGTLTHFAAPPVLMVARTWNWGTGFMLSHFGWRAVLSIALSTAVYFVLFRRQFADLASRAAAPEQLSASIPVADVALSHIPAWITVVHVGFMAWTVMTAHYPALFLGGFLFFIGFSQATAPYQDVLDLKSPLLVGFFLAGLVIHGGLQGWWIAPLLARLSEVPLFLGSALLTAFNDNALITYLGTLVPSLDEPRRIALVEGAVVGGGLTVIANAPNPAGQALLGRFFDGAVRPIGLVIGALPPTLIAMAAFRLF